MHRLLVVIHTKTVKVLDRIENKNSSSKSKLLKRHAFFKIIKSSKKRYSVN